jgi:hypothetical protein
VLRYGSSNASLMSLLLMPLAVVLVLQVQGGGNCANALTAAARLGLSPTIVTKVGCTRSTNNLCGLVGYSALLSPAMAPMAPQQLIQVMQQ